MNLYIPSNSIFVGGVIGEHSRGYALSFAQRIKVQLITEVILMAALNTRANYSFRSTGASSKFSVSSIVAILILASATGAEPSRVARRRVISPFETTEQHSDELTTVFVEPYNDYKYSRYRDFISSNHRPTNQGK